MKHPKNYSLPVSPSSSSSAQPSPTSSSTSNRPFTPTTYIDGSRSKTVQSSRSATLKKLDAFGEKPQFIELLARSNFSFLQGASHPEEMVLRAKALGYKGLAIVDVNGLYGVVRGYQTSEKPSLFDAEQLAYTNSDGTQKEPFHYMCGSELTPFDASPVALLPMNKDGYKRLCHLITKAKRPAPKGHISVSLKDICDENEDLIAIPLPPWREADLKKLQAAFQDRIYLPVHKDFTWESVELYKHALRIEHTLGIPLFATLRPLYHEPSRKPLHDVLTCVLHKTTLQQASTRLTLNRERYLKSPDHIAGLFRERPDLMSRTIEIASRIGFSLKELRYKYPQGDIPPGKTAPTFLRELVEKGLRWRYAREIKKAKLEKEDPAFRGKIETLVKLQGEAFVSATVFLSQVRKQVESELSLIFEKEYEDYFLTLFDICDYARSANILHQGRGSAANSIVCFVLGLTSVDPIKMGLLFERFISRERGEPPDIDIDFEHERREQVIQYIYKKYGERRAAMVCTVVCYRSRMAIREVAKIMGLTLAQVDALVKFMGREGLSRLVDNQLMIRDEKTSSDVPFLDLEKLGLTKEKFHKLLHLSLELQGFPRHLGIHSGGFVISHEPVIDIVPVESASMNQRFVIQWNKDDIETLGMMKIDVLSLGMLTAVQKAFDLLKRHKNIHWNLAQVPQDDPGTYKMIQKADTVGVFQIESRAQMSLLPRLRPANYYDLVIEVAIVRPGPIQGGMVHPYLKRRAGKEKIIYEHPSLVPILSKTLGIPLFQEQIMQIAVAVAGFTPGEADELRRVVSSAWKKKAVMDGLRQRVINGMLANKISQEYAERIYKTIEGFSSYGFPESHAASFALITYISCFLKWNHPEVFTCALLNSQPMGFYAPRQLISDAQRHGVKFNPLDVQVSDWDYTLEEPNVSLLYKVRTGFRSIYGFREEFALTIVRERAMGGAYKSLSDLIQRTQIPKAAFLRLAAAGALACFGYNAREALWAIQGYNFDTQSLFFGELNGLDEF
ncbi:MAG: DNA polymerase III subunit alpha, partial [Bdellovibrionota bacterium]